MRFTSLLSLSSLAAAVVGGPLQTLSNLAEPDINVILNVLDRVSTGIIKADAEVKLWLGDYEGSFRLLGAARSVHQDMAAGAVFISRLPNGTINAWDSLKITVPMATLMKSVESYTAGLIKNKGTIDSLSLTSQFLTSLYESRISAQALSKAIESKLPISMAWTVAPTTDVFINRLDKTAQVFGATLGAYIQTKTKSPVPSTTAWNQIHPANIRQPNSMPSPSPLLVFR
jgi:hypothetical protein